MPDLGKYSTEVLSAYAVTLVLLLLIVAITWWRSAHVRGELRALEPDWGAMPRIPILALLPLVIFAGLAGLFIAGVQRDDPDLLPSTREGLAAPEITPVAIADLPTFSSETLRAPGVKIVNFWASWCAPCRAEHPNLIALSQKLPIYGVNRDRTEEDALGFLRELGNPFAAVVADERNRQSIDWGVYALPETFVIDSEGRVVLHFRGPITQRSLASDFEPAFEKAR